MPLRLNEGGTGDIRTRSYLGVSRSPPSRRGRAVIEEPGDSGVPDSENLAARWDFSEASAADGETYGTVADASGNGRTLENNGATHATDAINGLPAAQFSGSEFLLGPSTSAVDINTGTATASVYLAWRSTDASQVGYILTQAGNTSRSLQGFTHLYHGGNSEVDFSIGGTVTANASLTDTNPHTTAALVDRSAGEATVSWDGETEATTAGSSEGSGPRLRVGARWDSSAPAGVYFRGYVGEILIYDGQHDVATHDEVMDYLSRWMP